MVKHHFQFLFWRRWQIMEQYSCWSCQRRFFFLYHLCCFLHRGIFSNYYYFFVAGYDWSLFRHYTVLWTIRIKWIFNSLQMRYKCCMVTFWGGIRKKVKPDVTPYYTMVSCHWNYSVLWYPKYKVDIAHPSSYKSIL